ncbi:tripartite tricarboxylate transporter permease [Halovenus salina]|uniref:Tripartite tricarboxylate transporter permease n=1 Tax=Halovenus salina TaxID=1510225 RepID=A0ABD5W3T0_9EURY|nr:tripartite tricarboxylate transporter permease [Halovenus salina]
MDPAVGVAPVTTVTALVFVLGGISLGTVSGLIPGLHANNFALLLASVAPAVPAEPLYVGAAMLAAGVTHTFLDIVPALALGVPDPAMAPTALPGHQLVLEGRGHEALRLSALGSALAVGFAVPLAVPITLGMERLYPTIAANISVVLGVVALLLVVTERTLVARLGGALSLVLSGALGVLTLDVPTGGVLPAGNMLAPLFAGLFGAPILIEALDGEGVPPQDDTRVTTSRRFVVGVGLVGTLCGAFVGYLPGISAAIAAGAAMVVLPQRGPRAFVVATSGVSTANSVFALFALVALGSPRTGVLVAVENTNVPHNLPILLGSIAIAAAIGFILVLLVGDRYLELVGAVDNRWLSVGVLGFLCVLVAAFTGVVGLVVFAVSTVVGLIPARFGSRRMTLMGVLLVPLAL